MASATTLELRRSRNFGDMLNLTFEFFRVNFKIIAKSVVFLAGPPMIIAGAVMGSAINLSSMSLLRSTDSVLISFLIALVFFGIGTALAYGSVTEIINLKALDPEGEVTFEQVWKETRRDFLMILFTGIASTVLILLGSLLLIIPGIYLAITLSMILMVRVHEGGTFSEALSRCNELIKGYWWATFGLLFVVNMVIGVLAWVIQIPFTILFGAGALFSTGSDGMEGGVIYILYLLALVVSRLLVTIVLVIASSLQYFNLAEKFDGTGLLERIASIGTQDLPQEVDESSW